ncbi:hypothetical protein DN068_17130 [Taibaiella soli]|uniref:Uncharacterized protein n=1 Tax=Taibaiella soli TaxID=1649169 RepID=A0A2W2AVT7_9BACT|nr:hypothetical protein DN068_17130 [Taibaiella soli]
MSDFLIADFFVSKGYLLHSSTTDERNATQHCRAESLTSFNRMRSPDRSIFIFFTGHETGATGTKSETSLNSEKSER